MNAREMERRYRVVEHGRWSDDGGLAGEPVRALYSFRRGEMFARVPGIPDPGRRAVALERLLQYEMRRMLSAADLEYQRAIVSGRLTYP